MKFEQTFCVLDRDCRLIWTGGDWDSFALANGGPAAHSNAVLSTSLLDHVADVDTRDSVQRMVSAVVRKQSLLRIDYRGDSPLAMRRFRLTVQAMREDRVLMVHDLRDVQQFATPLTPWRTDQDSTDCKCSYCASVRDRHGIWRVPERLPDPHPPRVAYTVCPTCRSHVDEAVQAVLENRKPRLPIAGGFGP